MSEEVTMGSLIRAGLLAAFVVGSAALALAPWGFF